MDEMYAPYNTHVDINENEVSVGKPDGQPEKSLQIADIL